MSLVEGSRYEFERVLFFEVGPVSSPIDQVYDKHCLWYIFEIPA